MHVYIFVNVVNLTYTYFQKNEQCLHTYNPSLYINIPVRRLYGRGTSETVLDQESGQARAHVQ